MTENEINVLGRRMMRSLLLPIPVAKEQNAVGAFLKKGFEWVETIDELGIKIRVELDHWEQKGTASTPFIELARQILQSAWEKESPVPIRYFDLHKLAMGAPDRLDHMAARLLLADLPLIETLARVEGASAAQICRIFSARDGRSAFSWNTIKAVCSRLGWYRSLEPAAFQNLFELEKEQETSMFLDLALHECVDLVASQAARYGCRTPIKPYLTPILRPGETPFYAVLEVLHYQLSLLEFFDHAPTFLYEFQPRGELANWMHNNYPDSIKTGKQAFLNIAKSVYRITEGWAFSKDKSEESLAMARLLTEIENLGYAARREVARSIRMLVHRTLKQHVGGLELIPGGRWVANRIRHVISVVTDAPTGTRGILEQRVVDVLAASLHSEPEGWRASAIGCAVNATNRSGLKFGDCEFHHVSEGKIHAFEAHAGKLTRVYVDDHLATLKGVVPLRRHQLKTQFDLESLVCDVFFIAHELALDTTDFEEVQEWGGMQFRFHFKTFGQWAGEACVNESLADHWEEWFVKPLNNAGETLTPQEVRSRVLEILAEPTQTENPT